MDNRKPSKAWSRVKSWKKALLLPIITIALYLNLAATSEIFHTHAAINEVINFQGKLVNSDGTNITDGSYYFKVDIYDAAVGGSSLAAAEYKYVSTISSVTDDSVVYSSDTDESTIKVGMALWNTTDGDYAIIDAIDTGTNTITVDRDVDTSPYAWGATDAITTRVQLNDGIFNIKVVGISSLDFNSDSYYINIQFDSTPGGGDSLNETFSPRKRLDAVPYAFRSRYSDELGGIGSGQFLRSDTSDNYTSGTLAFDVGTTLDINGDLSIADTAIAFDGANTNFTMTGNLTINTDDLIVDKSTGRVGIGDTTPDHALDVSGNIGLTAGGYINWGDTDGESGYGFRDNGGTMQYKNSAGTWANFGTGGSLWTQSGSDIYYNSGNVGIGTTGPFNERLTLNGRMYIADTTAPVTTTNRLYSVSGVLYWNGVALGGSGIYSDSGSIAHGSYLDVAHNQDTYDVVVSGFYYDSVESKWRPVDNFSSTIDHDLGNEFNPSFNSKAKVTSVKVDYNEHDLGTGADGDITVTANTSINTTSLISGRSCADGGDAVNYSVTALTANTATLESSPSTGCLATGDEVLLINLRGTNSAFTNVGNYETFRVSTVSTNTVTFSTNKTKYYGDGASDDTNIGTGTGNQAVMLQRVPNYEDVTVNTTYNFYPDEWVSPNGTSTSGPGEGGVMFFRATGAVAINGTGSINANSKGYIGGQSVAQSTHWGGSGGEAFCGVGGAPVGGHGAAGAGAGYTDTAGNGYCGGGGGSYGGTDGTGSVSQGGAGGGGSIGAGGGGGYGTGGWIAGNTSQAGSNTSQDGSGANGGGGGGGSYGSATLEKLNFGSSGGRGGENNSYANTSGMGGDGGGIVYIAGNTVTVSGYVQSHGANGGAIVGTYVGGSGAGAGGSIKIIGQTVDLGSSRTTVTGGTGSTGSIYGNGGNGGVGRIAVYYSTSVSNCSTNCNSYTLTYNTYGLYVGEEIHTPEASAYGNISWTEDLDTAGEIQVQTRSGATPDSTDDSWEGWKPVTATTNELSLSNGDTHTDWTGTNATVADGDVTRDVDYFEDEDEATVGDVTKITSSTAGGYAEDSISSTDLSGYDYIVLWVRSSTAGNTLKFGFGESAATEQEETITVNQADTWQKVYWDISDITGTSRDGVTVLRLTKLGTASDTIYLDNVIAATYLSTSTGSTISSTADEYIQYRFILTTTDTSKSPTVSNIQIGVTNPNGTYTIDANRIRRLTSPDYHTDSRLIVIEENLVDYQEIHIEKNFEGVTQRGGYDPGTGADGDVNVTTNTNINTTSLISGRSCADGGDAVNYNVTSFSADGTQATLSTTPSSGCLSVGDEVLIINLQGTYTAFGNTGNYETLRIQSIVSSAITFTSAKTKYYGDNSNDDSNLGTAYGTQRVMLQRVPNYEDVTVNSSISFYPSDWNGSKGGVIFFRATGSVSISGNLHANYVGFAGATTRGAYGGGDNNGRSGAAGGEAFCGEGGTGGLYTANGNNGAAGGGSGQTGTGGTGYCGGGGGGGTTGGTGSGSAGGAGGGGTGYSGGGGGAGYGTVGSGAYSGGVSGSTNSSGNGGAAVGYGGGGGGGTYGDSDLEKLFFGSGGGKGPDYEVAGDYLGDGGDGGGIVFISASSITVSGALESKGYAGENNTGGSYGGGGGGGSGGSIKLVGNSVNLGSGVTVATGGAAGTGQTANGGAGGSGRIAVYAVSTPSGSSSPTAEVASVANNEYSIYTSDEVRTEGAVDYNKLRWWMNDDSYGLVEVQTRSGDSNNSLDGTWEEWRPVTTDTNVKSLQTCNTHGDWTGTNVTVTNAGVDRDVNYYEDEDEFGGSESSVDSYSESNLSYGYVAYGNLERGQSFAAGSGILDSVDVYLAGAYSPTGPVFVQIYAHSGTYGTSSVGTGSALAISDIVDASDIPSGGGGLVTFEFSGENRINLTDSYYVLTVKYPDGVGYPGPYVTTYGDSSSPSHSGNGVSYSPSTWTSLPSYDMIFYVNVLEPDMVKLTSSTTDGYASATITSADLSSYDYIAMWVYSSQSGNVIEFGFGESAATEQEKTFHIDTVNTWQKIYWDISRINPNSRDAVTALRLTNLASGAITIYLDNITADRYLTNSHGSEITSTAAEYLQYRFILTSSITAYRPQVYNVQIEFNNGYKLVIEDSNTVRLYNYTGSTKSLRLTVSTTGGGSGGSSLPSGAQGQLMYYDTGMWTATSTIFISSTSVGIGDTSPDHKLDVEGNIGLVASGYINFGDTDGTSGYGFRDNSGTLEYKNSGGSWLAVGGVASWTDPHWVIEAEYEGAVLSADGSDNTGTMTSDSAGSSNSWMNYYEFSSSQTSLNDYDIRVRFTLPEDFSTWDTNAIVFDYVTESTSDTNNKVDYIVYLESSAVADASDTGNVSASAGVWTTTTIASTDLGDCNAAGETCLLVIRLYSKDDYYTRVGDITFDYARP